MPVVEKANWPAVFACSSTCRSLNKASVESQLKQELKDSPNFQALKAGFEHNNYDSMSLESRLVQTWASSSGDHNTVAVAMQMAAKEVFGMKDTDISTKALTALKTYGSEEALMKSASEALVGSKAADIATTREGLKEFIAGMYRNTQSWFAERGITEVVVARGMKQSLAADVSVRNVSLQPMSSFSTSLSTASGFGSGGNVYIARVPASQVVGTFRSGFGCSNEHEVVVLGHKNMTAVRISAPDLNKAMAASYGSKQAQGVSAYIQAQLEEKAKFKGTSK